ncbi:MAG TPA: M20 family metallopeptidase [Chloroflexota bacterium]|nr:M20 family metallopeptidase [Chloroflexota bacterium]
MNDALKQLAAEAIDRRRQELAALSRVIHDNPELGFNETTAAGSLVEECRRLGWQTDSGICDLPTAWQATLPSSGQGPTVALLAEYDALPEIGHACGHNLMAIAPIAAAIGLEAVAGQVPGKTVVLGTPAEEGGGGKQLMVDRGVLAGIDAALLVHPSAHGTVRTQALACEHYEVEFRGFAAHAAASPEQGVNALNAMILSFNHIDALRQHIRPSARVHGIILHGGDKANIVPEHTSAEFIIRAADNTYLDELLDKVRKCFEGAALATGCSFEWRQISPRYETVNSNPTLSELYFQAMQQLGVDCPMDSDRGFGSTDMGNVSWRVPAIQPMFQIVDHVANHTREFTAAAVTERAFEATFNAAKAMAFTAIDLLSDPALLERARREFRESLSANGSQVAKP